MIRKIQCTSKTGKIYFNYIDEKGKRVSKEAYESFISSKEKPKTKRVRKVKPVEEQIEVLDKSEEWIGESGIYNKEVQEESKDLNCENVVSIQTEDYQQQVMKFEQSIEEAFKGSDTDVDTKEKPKKNVFTFKGFFTSIFDFWK